MNKWTRCPECGNRVWIHWYLQRDNRYFFSDVQPFEDGLKLIETWIGTVVYDRATPGTGLTTPNAPHFFVCVACHCVVS